ncbi:hypothetical protein IWX49DRAFT_641587 [Phyllosticta citricarpa]|uniref:Uncharacterized protein n=1 Tax=Phyllosticta paracitricarpa TaxID=2016321 RepID=A0ABR1MSV6_9PEZI
MDAPDIQELCVPQSFLGTPIEANREPIPRIDWEGHPLVLATIQRWMIANGFAAGGANSVQCEGLFELFNLENENTTFTEQKKKTLRRRLLRKANDYTKATPAENVLPSSTLPSTSVQTGANSSKKPEIPSTTTHTSKMSTKHTRLSDQLSSPVFATRAEDTPLTATHASNTPTKNSRLFDPSTDPIFATRAGEVSSKNTHEPQLPTKNARLFYPSTDPIFATRAAESPSKTTHDLKMPTKHGQLFGSATTPIFATRAERRPSPFTPSECLPLPLPLSDKKSTTGLAGSSMAGQLLGETQRQLSRGKSHHVPESPNRAMNITRRQMSKDDYSTAVASEYHYHKELNALYDAFRNSSPKNHVAAAAAVDAEAATLRRRLVEWCSRKLEAYHELEMERGERRASKAAVGGEAQLD